MLDNDFPCFIFSVSAKGLISDINSHMSDELGYMPSEVLGKLRFEDLLTGGSKIFYKTHFAPMLFMEGKVEEMFLTFRSKSGKELPLLLNMKAINHNDTQEIRCGGLQIAKRNKFEKQVIEAKLAAENALIENALLNQLKSQLEVSRTSLERQVRELRRINDEHIDFSKILAHDLQEPLRKLQVFASRLEERDAHENDVDSQLYLNRISGLSKYAHKLVVRLQEYHSLAIAPNQRKMSKIVPLVNTAISTLGLSGVVPDFSGLEVKEIYGDISKLTGMFEELIHNSHQFKSRGEPLSITISSTIVKDNYYRALEDTYRLVDFLKIKVRDNSSGFPAHALERVFKPLQRFHERSGTGLGMAYCKKIIELHNGTITIRPVQGIGSEFIILLPTKEALQGAL